MNIKQHGYLVGLLTLVVATASAQTPRGTLIDKIVAKVDNHIILQSELETASQQYLQQVGQETPNVKCEVLKKLILDKALLTKAQKDGVVVTKKQLAQQLDQTMQYWVQQAGSEKALSQSLGKSIAEIKSELREELQARMIVDEARRKVIGDVSATPREVKRFFNSLSVQERPVYPAEIVVKQLVKHPKVSQKEKERIVKKLEALKARLQNGESFEALAQEYSHDSGSASNGGTLGFWQLGELVPAYERAALALQIGGISEPVETQFGFHLIQLIARESGRYNTRHILLKPDEEAVDIEATKIALTQLRTSILARKYNFEEAAKDFSEDTSTASTGGLMIGEQGEEKIAIDDLSPDVFFAVEQLTPGEISKPVEFTTSKGRKAIRILFVEEKIPAHEANLTQDYAKIRKLLINKKRTNIFKKWLKDAKISASIKVSPEYQDCELLR